MQSIHHLARNLALTHFLSRAIQLILPRQYSPDRRGSVHVDTLLKKKFFPSRPINNMTHVAREKLINRSNKSHGLNIIIVLPLPVLSAIQPLYSFHSTYHQSSPSVFCGPSSNFTVAPLGIFTITSSWSFLLT